MSKTTLEYFGVVEDKIYNDCVASLPELTNKVIAITGCTSGTGFHAAVAAIRKNACLVIMLNRKSERAISAMTKLQEVVKANNKSTEIVTVTCDLQSFDSVRAAAAATSELAAKFSGVDVLLNNAGVMGFPDDRTADGFDVQMQTNHLSHFLLTKLLMPSLEAASEARGEAARVVQHSSGARSKMRAPDGVGNLLVEHFEKSEVGMLGGDAVPFCFNRYHQTKLSNSVFCMALHNRLVKAGKANTVIKSLVAEPGVASTDLAQNLTTVRNLKIVVVYY